MQRKSTNKNDKLFHTLYALCKIAYDKTIIYKNEGKLAAIPHQYIPVAKIDYSLSVYYYDWDNLKNFDYYEWRSRDFITFFDNELKILPEFEEATRQVVDEFKITEDVVKGIGLISLLRLIMEEAPNGRINLDSIENYIHLFIDGYESERSHLPVVWNVEVWLDNIYIESDKIEITQGVFLKRPSKEQLAEVRPKPNYINESDKMFGKGLVAGAILTFSVPVKNKSYNGIYPDIISQQIEQWQNVFRLFKPTDMAVVYQSITPNSIFEYSSSEKKERPQDKFWKGKVEPIETSSYNLYLKTKEEEKLRTFINKVRPTLKVISYKNYLSGSFYDLAFHRYNDSLLKTEVNAYRVLSAMTSLEALLSDGSTEITFKIRLRVAKLLSLFGFNPIEVSEKIKIAYSLRSKLVHGSKPIEKEKDLLEFAREYTHEIINYNRICLLIALQIKKSYDKQKMIKQIDNSLIDLVSDTELKRVITEEVDIHIINPYTRTNS